MTKGIIPHSKAKGTDICADCTYYYIIRSDLGCYLRTTDLKKGSDISILSLHHACQDGDHYLASKEDGFIIIKGNSFRTVKNLTTDADCKVSNLHPNCQGGDHYFAISLDKEKKTLYIIIFQEKATFRVTFNLQDDRNGEEHKLHPRCKNGLYYWGTTDYCHMQVSDWGVEYCKTSHMNIGPDFKVDFVHPDNIKFLPGGLSVTIGSASGVWEIIKTISNDTQTPMTWQTKINKKVGYSKENMSQITHNWKIDMSSTVESGKLSGLIAQCQFSFSAEYGGLHVSTDNDSWNEETETEEQLTFELNPNESVYLWQYRLSLGQESVLFYSDLKITNNTKLPTEVPLSVTQL